MKTKMMMVVAVLSVLVSGCCILMPDWVAVNVGSECIPPVTEDCPEANQHDGYCFPDECVYWACDCDAEGQPTECWRVYGCEETAARDGSRRAEPLCSPVECSADRAMNDGTCCEDGSVATWVQDDPNMEMYQICEPVCPAERLMNDGSCCDLGTEPEWIPACEGCIELLQVCSPGEPVEIALADEDRHEVE